MQTQYFNAVTQKENGVRLAGSIIRSGGLVAFPTETVYGLGANGLDPAAVEGIFRAKGRPFGQPPDPPCGQKKRCEGPMDPGA